MAIKKKQAGKGQQSAAAMQKQAEREAKARQAQLERDNINYVLNQPHRRWAGRPNDPRLSTDVGSYLCLLEASHPRWVPECYEAFDWLRLCTMRLNNARGLPDPEDDRVAHQATRPALNDNDARLLIDNLKAAQEAAINTVRTYKSELHAKAIRQLCVNFEVPTCASYDVVVDALRCLNTNYLGAAINTARAHTSGRGGQ